MLGLYLSEKYNILSKIGQGSFGKSYLAVEINTNRLVAIKVFENDTVWNNLKEYEQLLHDIDNQYIVHIYAVEEIGSYKCLVQEYIKGVTLDEYISNVDLTLAEFLNIASGMLEAIENLETLNLSHKDIKPSNIMFDIDKKIPKLIDLDCMSFSHISGKRFIGTIIYSSPEQIIYNKPSNEADIYSLGMVLCFLILGRVPFHVDIKETIELIKNDIETALRKNAELSGDIADKIITLVSGLLEYIPEQRLTSSKAIQQVDELLQKSAEEHQENVLIYKRTVAYSNRIEPIDIATFMNETVAITSPITFFPLFDQEFSSNSEDEKKSKFSKDNLPTVNINKEQEKRNYQEQLLREYENILFQAKVSFGLWVFSFIVCFLIVFISIFSIVKGDFLEGIITVILDASIIAIQKLFNIREDHYRKMMEQKIKHLETGDYLDYAFEKVDKLENTKDKNAEILKLISTIREHAYRNEK